MVAITHNFVSAVADDPAAVLAGQVVPSKWNEAHAIAMAATARVVGRKTAGAGAAEEVSLSELLDFIGSAAQGDILYRGASSWARLGAGTANQVLKTGGAAANPSWADIGGLADPGANGLMSRTALNTTTARAITAGTNIAVTNGDGVSGNPVISFTGTLPVANGGTGKTSLTANRVILGNGTSAVQEVAPGTAGNVLTSDGTTWGSSALPTIPTQATTGEIAAESAVTKYISPDRLKNSPAVAKAWCVFTFGSSGNTSTLLKGYNIASISGSSSSPRITFTNAMADTNYVALVTDEAGGSLLSHTKTTGYIDVISPTSGHEIHILIFG